MAEDASNTEVLWAPESRLCVANRGNIKQHMTTHSYHKYDFDIFNDQYLK